MNPSTTTTPASASSTGSGTAQEDRVSQRLRTLADDAEALLKATARAGDEKIEHSRERLRDELHQLRSRLGELEADASARIRNASRQTDEAVREHPYSAMGVAAVAGVLLGFLLGRR